MEKHRVMRSVLQASAVSLLSALNQRSAPVVQDAPPRLTSEMIQKILAAAGHKAGVIKVPVGIAVVDQCGNLTGFLKLDGAPFHVYAASFARAFTAAVVRKPTHQTGLTPQTISEIAAAAGGKLTASPGGFPLVVEDQVIGGIGVSGGEMRQDLAVALAGLAAIR
jgi:uncharacterized protein GlcG (DUF336 family)